MSYPELFLVPIFMLLDYYLTIVGVIQRDKVYAQHFKVETYELNPRWQSDITKRRWINRRHLAMVSAVTIGLVALLEFSDIQRSKADFALGMFLIMFGLLITRHLANIALFITLANNPQLINGEVTLTQSYVMYASIVQLFSILALLLMILLFSPSAFVTGGVIGVIILMAHHFRWLRRLDKQQATSAPNPNKLEKSSADTR